jgi:hypothetical protein
MNRTATVTPSQGPGPGPGPGPAPPAIPRKLRPGPGERRRGRGARVKRRRRRGSPAPYLGKIAGAIVHFSTSCTARPPKTNRCASRFALTPKTKASAILASARPRGGWERANPPKSLFRTLAARGHMLHACKCSAESARYSAIVSIDDRIFLRSRVCYINEREFY